MGRLKNTSNPYFLPSSFASAEQECVSKQLLWAVFAGGTFCGCGPIFHQCQLSAWMRVPLRVPFPGSPLSYSCPSLLGWQSSPGFLCLSATPHDCR